MTIRIVPSILSADFAKLGDEIEMCEAGGADLIHIDVMDGQFVPNLTYGAKVIDTVRRCTSLPLDVHLMVLQPENYFDDFVRAGASGLTVHAEVAPHLHRQLTRIRELGCHQLQVTSGYLERLPAIVRSRSSPRSPCSSS